MAKLRKCFRVRFKPLLQSKHRYFLRPKNNQQMLENIHIWRDMLWNYRWTFLEVETQAKFDPVLQAYAAGYLEGEEWWSYFISKTINFLCQANLFRRVVSPSASLSHPEHGRGLLQEFHAVLQADDWVRRSESGLHQKEASDNLQGRYVLVSCEWTKLEALKLAPSKNLISI